MIRYLLFILAFCLNINLVKAQDPIMVTTTGVCNPITGEFAYDGTLNGKNHYTKEYVDYSGTFYFHVSFDNTQWVLYVDEDIDQKAFYNTNIPSEMLPPNNEWIVGVCGEGTMYIEGGISIGVKDLPKTNQISIYNSLDNSLKIKLTKISKTKTKIKLYNVLGQTILSKSIKANSLSQEIDLSTLKTGVYIVHVLDIRKFIFVY